MSDGGHGTAHQTSMFGWHGAGAAPDQTRATRAVASPRRMRHRRATVLGQRAPNNLPTNHSQPNRNTQAKIRTSVFYIHDSAGSSERHWASRYHGTLQLQGRGPAAQSPGRASGTVSREGQRHHGPGKVEGHVPGRASEGTWAREGKSTWASHVQSLMGQGAHRARLMGQGAHRARLVR